MDVVADELLKIAAAQLRGTVRRRFLAEVCERMCGGNFRQAEQRFGWGRGTIEKGQAERESGPIDLKARTSRNRGQKRSEDTNSQLAIDIRLIVEPHTQSDPELKSERQYTDMSAKEVRDALRQRGYTDEQLPSERTLRDILNRMNYRLKRIQKAKPLKKTEHTDAIFDNVKTVRAESADNSETLEISVDTKAKVKLGEYSQGGENPERIPRAAGRKRWTMIRPRKRSSCRWACWFWQPAC